MKILIRSLILTAGLPLLAFTQMLSAQNDSYECEMVYGYGTPEYYDCIDGYLSPHGDSDILREDENGNPPPNDPTQKSTTDVTQTIIEDTLISTDAAELDFSEDSDNAEPLSDNPDENVKTTSNTTTGGNLMANVTVKAGSSESNGVTTDTKSINIPIKLTLNDRVDLKLSVPIYYSTLKDLGSLGDVSIYGSGIVASLPYRLAKKSDGKNYRWRVTPTVGLTFSDSSDLDYGTWSVVLGASSSYAFKVHKKVILNIGNAITASRSFSFNGREFAAVEKDSYQLVNGLQAIYMPGGRFIYNVYIMDTRKLNNAYVDAYQTYGIGTNYKISKKIALRLFANSDQGDDYHAEYVGFSSAFQF